MRTDGIKKKTPGEGPISVAPQLANRSDASQLVMDLARERARAQAAIADFDMQMLEWKKAALVDLALGLRYRSMDRIEQVRRLRQSLQEERATTLEMAILNQKLAFS